MRISLKKFTRDPYKYGKKAPITLLLGDDPAFELVPYQWYKEQLAKEQHQAKEQSPSIQILGQPKKKSWLWRLLFT